VSDTKFRLIYWGETVKTSLLTKVHDNASENKILSDEALMVRFKTLRDNQCFKLLFDRYKHRLYSVAFTLLGDAYEAEEIVQEAFIRVWRNCHKFRRGATFGGWMFTIIQNLCKDIWRSRRRRRVYEAIHFKPLSVHEQEDSAKTYRKTVNQSNKTTGDPHKQAENSELRVFINSCLEQLPDNQKQVVILRDLEGRSYKNIANLTGVSIGTVRSRLYYGRQKLKEIMK
jgi:RNA polymerase sigma-70 factor, ECF subfamily